MLKGIMAVGLALVFPGTGCIYVSVPAEISLSSGSPTFVVSGVAQAIEDNGSCFVWAADDGTIFVLFQAPALKNTDFDRVITPGTRSRLSLTVRSDLGFLDEPCYPGAVVVQVDKVLEITGQTLAE